METINMSNTIKKFLTVFTVTMLLGAFSACSKEDSDNTDSQPETTTSAIQAETTQPDPLAPKTEAAAATETTATASTSAVTKKPVGDAENTTSQPDPLGGGAFSYDDNGAVVFEDDFEQQDDRILISAAQALFESACRTQWKFTVGCPYDIDINDYVENNFGWQFYKITDSSIHSFSDVENDYFKVFSDRYPHELSELYIENNGAVYALSGQRGSDYFYSMSKVTDIGEQNGNEIFFTVENYYDGSDFSPEAYSQTEEFSVVIGDDGVWRAGKFRLPY